MTQQGESTKMMDARAMARAVRRANVRYGLGDFQTGHEFIPPYLANGWIGGSFDEFGFLSKPNFDYPHGRRQFGYVNHYYRYNNGGHNQATLFYLTAARADGRGLWIGDLQAYRQELDLYDMTLNTSWRAGSDYRLSAFASMAVPELFELRFDCRLRGAGDALAVRMRFDTLKAENNASRYKDGQFQGAQLAFHREAGGWRVRATTNSVTTELIVAGVGLTLENEGSDLVVTVPDGRSVLRALILDRELGERRAATEKAVAGPSAHLRREHVAAAHAFWETSALFLPQGPAANVWTRSAYYLAAAVAPMPAHIMVPTGLNNNIWKHGFPQDMYYVVENLPRLGHFARARAQMPYWLDNLEAVKRYTRRIAKREGAFYPWIPPFRDWDDFEKEGPTNADAFEFHNSAYVAAMVWNDFKITGDRAFLERHFPILEEVARFYLDITGIDAAGKGVIRHPDLRCQDESSSHAGPKSNAICAIWSSLYTLRAYRDACALLGRRGDVLERAADVLRRGYDLASLERAEGLLKAFAEDDRPLGRQKHPSQLNPVTYLPMRDFIDGYAPVRACWERRYDLTEEALLPNSPGWTLAEFTLASARMRSGEEVARDLRMVQPARYADPHWIQFYESSGREPWHFWKAYYFTASGLYLQALTDCVVQYCRGVVDLFAALLPEWAERELQFHGLWTDGGLKVSGRWKAGAFRVRIEPSRDVQMPVRVSRDVSGIRAREEGGREWTFDGQTDVPVTFRAGRAVTLEWGQGL